MTPVTKDSFTVTEKNNIVQKHSQQERLKQKWGLANYPSTKSRTHSLNFLVSLSHTILYYNLDPMGPLLRLHGYIKNVWMHLYQFQGLISMSGKLEKVQNIFSLSGKVKLNSHVILDDSYLNMASYCVGRESRKYSTNPSTSWDFKRVEW